MNKTEKYYKDHAKEYIDRTMAFDMADVRETFMSHVRESGRILDIGFGSGRDSLSFQENGYEVVSLDPVEEFCEHGRVIGLNNVVCGSIIDFKSRKKFDGIWACASLHHLKRDDFEIALQNIHKLLKKGGIFYFSIKRAVKKDEYGRFFLKISRDAVEKSLRSVGFNTSCVWESKDHQGREDEWIDGYIWKL